MKTEFLRAFLTTAIVLGNCGLANAEESFPSHPIRIIVNTGPGGLVDYTTRLIAQQLSINLKQSVIVENRPGGDGLVGINAVKTASPDGYTLLASAGTMVYQQVVKKEVGYDLTKDFTGVGFIGRSALLLVEAPEQPDKTLKDFVNRAKSSPNKLSYASAGIGTGTHLGAAMFLQQAGVKLAHIPYKGNGPAMPDVMSGRVTMILDAYGSSKGYLAGGKLKALGVTSPTRLAAAPDVPTFAEQGVPNFSFYTWMGIVAPAGTPKASVQRISDALNISLKDKSLSDRLLNQGIEETYMPPAEFNQFLAKQLSDTSSIVTSLGIEKQ